MKKNIIILENIRSAYNTGNIIRTAEVLGREVILAGYTPHPEENPKVKKTALGAEEVVIGTYRNVKEALDFVRNKGYFLIAAECTDKSVAIDELVERGMDNIGQIALIVGNEKSGVLPETLGSVDTVCHIPLHGKKDSLNVGQAAAICMWEFGA